MIDNRTYHIISQNADAKTATMQVEYLADVATRMHVVVLCHGNQRPCRSHQHFNLEYFQLLGTGEYHMLHI